MKRFLPILKPRHIGVAGAGVLLGAAAALWLASMQSTELVAGFKPVLLQQGGAGYAVERWQIPTQHRWFYLGGMTLCLIGVGSLAVVKVGDETLLNIETLPDDIPETIQVITAHTNQLLSDGIGTALSWALLSGKKTARLVYLRTAPVPIKDAIAQLKAEKTWFKRFLAAPHNWVVGETRAGKSYLVCKLLIVFFESNPDGIITICDINYGKPTNTGELSDWLGIPPTYIRSDFTEISAAVAAEVEELERRRQVCKDAATAGKRVTEDFQPRLLIVDELDVTADELNGKDGEFITGIRRLLKMGAGYGMKILLCGQSLAVGETSISEALRSQMAIALVIRKSVKRNEVSKLKASDTDLLIERARQIINRGYRAAIVQLEFADPVVSIVPDLSDIRNTRFVVETPTDPDATWWASVYTQETQAWLQDLAHRYTQGEIKSPVKSEVAPKFGVRVRSDDTRYLRFVKPAWSTALEKCKPKGE